MPAVEGLYLDYTLISGMQEVFFSSRIEQVSAAVLGRSQLGSNQAAPCLPPSDPCEHRVRFTKNRGISKKEIFFLHDIFKAVWQSLTAGSYSDLRGEINGPKPKCEPKSTPFRPLPPSDERPKKRP